MSKKNEIKVSLDSEREMPSGSGVLDFTTAAHLTDFINTAHLVEMTDGIEFCIDRVEFLCSKMDFVDRITLAKLS